MNYTIVANWGWYKHADCKGAYSLHSADCKFLQTRNDQNSQGIIGEYEDIESAIAEAHFDAAVCRFVDVVKEFGFWQMVIVCKCANQTKKSVKALVNLENN